MNGTCVYGRNLKVQSRNHQQLQQQGHVSGPGGIHSLDPSFGRVQHFSGPSQPCGQQALMQTPSLLGMPGNSVFAMAQQQMALLNAYQPIPLAANPFLNAPRERYSDRHGSLNCGRNNQYMRDNYSRSSGFQRDNYSRNSPYQRDNYSSGNRKQSHNHQNATLDPYSNRNSKDKSGMMGNMQHHQGRFDYGRLGPPPNRDHYHSPQGSDHYSRHGDRHDRHRSESHHNKYDSHRSSGRHHSSRHDNRNYRWWPVTYRTLLS